MTLLEVKNLKKIYTTRFGGNQVQALSNVKLFGGGERICGDHGRVRIRKDNTFKYSGSAG